MPAEAQDQRFDRAGVYIAVSDVERSAAFYTQLLDRQPSVSLPVFVGFDVAGGLVAVVSRDAFAPGSEPSAAVAPYIKVRDINAEFARIRAFAPDAVESGIIDEGALRLLKVTDPDGNLIEFYQVRPPA